MPLLYQCSNDVEFKLAKFLQLIGTIKKTIFKKVRTETVLKLYNTFNSTHIFIWVR